MTQALSIPARDLAYLTAQKRVPALSVLAVRVAVAVSKWAMRRRTRLALRHLPDHLLRDIGATREAAHLEARRVFWRG